MSKSGDQEAPEAPENGVDQPEAQQQPDEDHQPAAAAAEPADPAAAGPSGATDEDQPQAKRAAPASYEPAPPGRSKKRKAAARAAAATAPAPMVRLLDPVARDSLRLSRDRRPVRLSPEDRAPQIRLDPDGLGAGSSKGYRSVRATHGAAEGTWYYETAIEYLGDSGAVRLGWATRDAELQASVGADAHGFAARSGDGAKIHRGVREDYDPMDRGFKEGDVVGCTLHLPPGGRPLEKGPEDVIAHHGHTYFAEIVEGGAVEPARCLEGSYVEWSVNGVSLGRVYEGAVPEGTWYPSLSLFTKASSVQPARVRVNFGEEEFKHLPEGLGEEGGPRAACHLPNAAPPPSDD